MPPKIAVPSIARGISLRGFFASSPKVAAASKPANERKPKTTPRNTVDPPVPFGIEKTDQSTPSPPGAVPPMSLERTMNAVIRMRTTVTALQLEVDEFRYVQGRWRGSMQVLMQ